MAAASDYLEDKLLDHALGTAAFTEPTAVYLALFDNVSTNTAVNLEAGTITDEISGGSYARQAAGFDSAADGSAANTASITFPTATADWGTITHVAIMDALTGGNVLFWGAVTTAKLIETNDIFQVTAGNLTITLD